MSWALCVSARLKAGQWFVTGVSSPATNLTFGFLGNKFSQRQLLHGGISQDAGVGWLPATFDHG